MSLRVAVDDFAEAARGLGWMAVERVRTGIVFNPLRAELRVDPHPFYRALRQKDPFHRTFAGDGWVVSRYADVVRILTDKTLSADERNMRRWQRLRAREARAGIPDPYDLDLSSMLRRDPPDHTRLRALVGKAFSPRAVARMRPRIASLVDELLDALPSHGEIDWVRDFAAPVPVTVIAEMLGVPAHDRERFRRWSDAAVGLLGDGPRDRVRRGLVAMRELGGYIASVAEERRRSPRSDLLSELVAAEEQGDRLSARELVSTSILLLIAGNETTTKLIGNATLALLRHPDQLALLREEPARVQDAVEELLRFDGPVQLTSRIATADREVCGRRVRRGEQLILLLAGANRDPEQFDDPDRLDVTRTNVRHLGFGQGVHFCLGAGLARLEASLALEALVTRLPGLALGSRPVQWGSSTILRGPVTLPLRIGGRRGSPGSSWSSTVRAREGPGPVG